MKKINILLIFSIVVLLIIIVMNFTCFTIFKYSNFVKEWKKDSNNPVLGNQNIGTVFDPYIMKDSDGKYRMYVSWRKNGSIAVTKSEDGKSWEELKEVLKSDKSTGWEDAVNRASVIYKDNMYYMWYTGQANEVSKIGYATSQDGYTFEKKNGPVLIPEEEYEGQSVMNPYVMYDEQEKIYKMWYAAGENYEPDVISYAISKDGINWTKYSNNPIMEKNQNSKSLDNYKVGACEVHKINNEYVMFYIGYTDINTARIFVAKSKDGVHNWKRYGKYPIVKPTISSFDSDACYKPTVIWNEEDSMWMLWYNGRKDGDEYIGLATCKEYNFLNLK